MQVKNVPLSQVQSCAQVHCMQAVSAYAAPGWVGVMLRPIGTYYRRRSASGRRVHAVCWHGHERFLRELFARYPDAIVRTTNMYAQGKDAKVTITKDTLSDWLELSSNVLVGSMFHGYYTPLELCDHENGR